MTAVPSEHSWSENALFNKTLIYIQKMEQHNANEWEYAFFSSLSLEFLCRAAVAHVSPALLAGNGWQNTYFALGNPPTSKTAPNSAKMGTIVEILCALIPDFVGFKNFCDEHVGRRNAELHSGDLGFENLDAGRWLGKYYAASKILLASMGKDLSAVLKDAAVAEEMIAALEDDAAKSVERDIKAAAALWAGKTPEEQEEASRLALAWASREKGHKSKCPACAQPGLLRGTPHGEVTSKLGDDDEIIQTQAVVPSTFECIACGLKISGLSRLTACQLGTPYIETSRTSAAEYFGLFTEDDVNDALYSPPPFDDDNNE